MPARMLTIEDLNLAGKRVFLRVDINTPVDPNTGELIDQKRLDDAAITIRDLPKSRVVVASHQGRVGRSDYLSMGLHAKALSRILGKEVAFVEDVCGPTALERIDALGDGEVLMLDNLRFAAEENQEYKPAEAEKTFLVSRIRPHIDACVLDALSTGHRASPTIVGFADLVPTGAGVVLSKELRALDKIVSIEKGPYVTVLGGTKASDRMETIDALLANNRADKILLCGTVGLVFLKASGIYKGDIGVDDEEFLVIKAGQLLKQEGKRYELPIDVAIKVDGERREVDVQDLKTHAQVYDVGPRTVEKYARIIKGAGTVFMNGPPGAFELSGFGRGTESLLDAMANSFGTSIASGGQLASALRKYGTYEKIDHVSTAGGALVQYLAGKRLPLIDALERGWERWGPKRDVSELWSSMVTLTEGLGAHEDRP